MDESPIKQVGRKVEVEGEGGEGERERERERRGGDLLVRNV